MAEPLPLLVESLTKSFGPRRALDGADLQVRPGEIFGLLGPNGAGKTTLVRAVAGRVVPDRGNVTVFGSSPAAAVRTGRVGWVPQELAIYPLLTPEENLWTLGRYQGLTGAVLDAAIRESLAWIGLADRARDRTDKLSGGMRRRLNMAAGTIHQPGLLLLDEPTVGVDPQSRERIYTMIRELQGRGVSILYTTHYMEEAERLCDSIAIIDDGRIIASGTKEELVRATLGGGQALTVDTNAPIDGSLKEALVKSGASIDGTRLLIAVEDAPRQIRELLERLNAEGVGVRDLTLKGATLEQVFLHLTGRGLREMIFAVARNRVMNLLHDRAALVLSFVLPIAFFTIFASIFAGSGRAATRRPRVAIADLDGSAASGRLVEALRADPSLVVSVEPIRERGAAEGAAHTLESAERAVRNGQVSVALVIPRGFGQAQIGFSPGADRPKVLLLADTSDPVAPQMLAGLLQRAVMNAMPSAMARGGLAEIDRWAGGLTPEQKAAMGRALERLDSERPEASAAAPSGSPGGGGVIDVETRDVLGEQKKNPSVALLASGLGVMFLLFSAAGAGGALIEEAETGTIDRILATRVTMGTLLGGKLLYLAGLAATQLTLMFAWAALFFGLELPSARVPAVLAMTLATALSTSAFGLLLASVCRSRMQLVALSNLVILAMSALGGSMFPRFLMPEKIQKLGLLTINGWSLEGFQRVFWREEGLVGVLPYAGVLVGLALLFFLAARRIARRWEAA